MNSKQAVILFGSAVLAFVGTEMYNQIRNVGRYEIVPLHKAKQRKLGVIKVIQTEWAINELDLNMEKILQTHFVLIYYRNEAGLEIQIILEQNLNGKVNQILFCILPHWWFILNTEVMDGVNH